MPTTNGGGAVRPEPTGLSAVPDLDLGVSSGVGLDLGIGVADTLDDLAPTAGIELGSSVGAGVGDVGPTATGQALGAAVDDDGGLVELGARAATLGHDHDSDPDHLDLDPVDAGYAGLDLADALGRDIAASLGDGISLHDDGSDIGDHLGTFTGDGLGAPDGDDSEALLSEALGPDESLFDELDGNVPDLHSDITDGTHHLPDIG